MKLWQKLTGFQYRKSAVLNTRWEEESQSSSYSSQRGSNVIAFSAPAGCILGREALLEIQNLFRVLSCLQCFYCQCAVSHINWTELNVLFSMGSMTPVMECVFISFTDDDADCGRRTAGENQLDTYIESGSVATHAGWPWHAALLRDGQYLCSATVVSMRWLLTSARCLLYVTSM